MISPLGIDTGSIIFDDPCWLNENPHALYFAAKDKWGPLKATELFLKYTRENYTNRYREWSEFINLHSQPMTKP